MRVNPGIAWKEEPALDIFPGTIELIHQFGSDVGLKVFGNISSYETLNGTRLEFVYRYE